MLSSDTTPNIPHWLPPLAKMIRLNSVEALVPPGADADAARVPILQRILREVTLPTVTSDEWGVREPIEGVAEALTVGGKRLAAAWAATRAAARVKIRQIVIQGLQRLEGGRNVQ